MQTADFIAIETAKGPTKYHVQDDDGPHYIAWTWPNGLITVSRVNTGDKYLDGWTILSFHEFTGVEAGPSQIFAEECAGQVMLFEGSFEECGAIFAEWTRLAQENDRPQVFMDHGLEGLVKLGKTTRPTLPEIDREATDRFNRSLEVGRRWAVEAAKNGEELTLDDCIAWAEAVDASAINADLDPV